MQPQPEGGHRRTHLVAVLGVRASVAVSGTRDQRIAAVAGRQRARISRGQLAAAGIADGTVTRLVARGALVREHPGVYVVAPRIEVPFGPETAALLACGEGAVLSHRSAAHVWGLIQSPPSPVEVTAATRQTRDRHCVTVHRSRTLLPRDLRVHQGLPVTSPARTLLDLAGVLTPRQLEWTVDQALLTRLTTLARLNDVLARAAGRRGAQHLRTIVEREGPSTRTRSHPEGQFLALVRQAGLPAPEVNARAHGYEIDFLWRAENVALELDSWGFHRTRNAFERDRRKGAVLAAAGISVVRATDTQLESEPLQLVVRIAQTLARAA